MEISKLRLSSHICGPVLQIVLHRQQLFIKADKLTCLCNQSCHYFTQSTQVMGGTSVNTRMRGGYFPFPSVELSQGTTTLLNNSGT